MVLADTEDTWTSIFAASGQRYELPKLVLFTDADETACGLGSAAQGPFYCPRDRKVYLDLGFFDELSQRFGAPGDFAQAYVIAHEIGHHVQNLLGIADKVDDLQQPRSRGEANQLSVRLELQADCFAGVWGNHGARRRDSSSRATPRRACARPPPSATTASSAWRRAACSPSPSRTARRSSASSGCGAASTRATRAPARPSKGSSSRRLVDGPFAAGNAAVRNHPRTGRAAAPGFGRSDRRGARIRDREQGVGRREVPIDQLEQGQGESACRVTMPSAPASSMAARRPAGTTSATSTTRGGAGRALRRRNRSSPADRTSRRCPAARDPACGARPGESPPARGARAPPSPWPARPSGPGSRPSVRRPARR